MNLKKLQEANKNLKSLLSESEMYKGHKIAVVQDKKNGLLYPQIDGVTIDYGLDYNSEGYKFMKGIIDKGDLEIRKWKNKKLKESVAALKSVLSEAPSIGHQAVIDNVEKANKQYSEFLKNLKSNVKGLKGDLSGKGISVVTHSSKRVTNDTYKYVQKELDKILEIANHLNSILDTLSDKIKQAK